MEKPSEVAKWAREITAKKTALLRAAVEKRRSQTKEIPMKQDDVVEAVKNVVSHIERYEGCDRYVIAQWQIDELDRIAALSAQHSDLADELETHFEEYNAAEDEGAADQAKLDLSEFVLNAAPSILTALRSNRAAIEADEITALREKNEALERMVITQAEEAAEATKYWMARVKELEGAGQALIDDVRRRYPGEELRCPYMVALNQALKGDKQS